MSLGSEGGVPAVMNVTPTGTSNGNNGGGWGGDWASWILLFLIFGMFGFGGFGGFGMGGWGSFGGMGGAYPVESILQRSLDTQTIIGKLDGVNQGLCDGFYAQNNAINGLGMNVMQGFHGADNAICNLGYQTQQGFNAMQTAYMQGQNALQAQLAQCCCDNRVGQMQIMNQMGADTCAVTNVIQNTARDGIDNQNRNHQALMDKLCQMEYNGLNDKYQAALAENQALKFQVSQTAQNSAIGAMISASEATILRRTGAECPVNAYVVQPPTPVTFPTNCCGQANYAGNYNGGCGCGNNAAGCC